MERPTTFSDAMSKLGVSTEDTGEVIKTVGITPASVVSSTQFKSYIVVGITPEEFSNRFAAVEFNYNKLRVDFANFCEDFNHTIEEGKSSKALEFSSKMLFEIGPNLRNEQKTKLYKAVRFHFRYDKKDGEDRKFHIKTVIVSTFRETSYVKNIDADGKLILTFMEAGILAMDIFVKAMNYVYMKSGLIMMTPLCGAIFSRDCVKPIAEKLKTTEDRVAAIINASTCSGGQYLDSSDMACAIVAAICVTKSITNKNAREFIITKIVKQYSAIHKQFIIENFNIFSEFALGGVPPGMDASTVVENYKNIQIGAVNMRVVANSVKETMGIRNSVDAGLVGSSKVPEHHP